MRSFRRTRSSRPGRHRPSSTAAFALAVAAVLLGSVHVALAPEQPATSPDAATGAPPLSHPRIDHPEDLDGRRAEEIYAAIRSQLQQIYWNSGDPVTIAYSKWRRYNEHPYISSRHGQLLVNNYANSAALDYGRYEAGGEMPAGALVVKDSFIVTTEGDIKAGPFFLMEKMPSGFDSLNGDWRYMLISQDGEVEGISGGYGGENVEFCAACHRSQAPASDHLFFVPRHLRR